MPDQTVGRDRLIFANGTQGSFTYTRLKGGQVDSVTSGNTDGANATYGYNSLNLIRSISSGTQSYSLTYDAVGNLVYQTYPNGTAVTYIYDDLNRLTAVKTLLISNSAFLTSYEYSLGPTGNRIGMTEYGGRAVTWTPDDLYRLTQEDIGNASVTGSIGYTMDNVGNRQTRSSNITAISTQTFSGAYDLSDRCTATGFTWDANGNMLTDLQGRTFTYDPLNRLTSVTGTGVAVSYVYNADDLRVKKINSVSGVTTEYHWDMANVTGYPQVLEELESGAVVCRYAYGPTGVLSQSRKVNGSWVTSYFGKDAQSVRFLMDESGNITDSWTWDAYGNLLGRAGSTTCNLGFDGEYTEPETGLVYLRARWYDPTTGRFVQMDVKEGDAENPLTLNKYIAFAQSPNNMLDPTGYYFEQPTGPRISELLKGDVLLRAPYLDARSVVYKNDSDGPTHIGMRGMQEFSWHEPWSGGNTLSGSTYVRWLSGYGSDKGLYEYPTAPGQFTILPSPPDAKYPIAIDSTEESLIRLHPGHKSAGCIVYGDKDTGAGAEIAKRITENFKHDIFMYANITVSDQRSFADKMMRPIPYLEPWVMLP